MPSRRRFIAAAGAAAAGAALPFSAHAGPLPAPLDAHRLGPGAPPAPRRDLTVEDLARAEAVQGLSFTPNDRALMLDDVAERLDALAAVRDAEPPNHVPPALVLDLGLSGRGRPTTVTSPLPRSASSAPCSGRAPSPPWR